MRQYRKEIEETKKIEKIICNKCGREIEVKGGVPQEDVLEVNKRWGYFSRKDNQLDQVVLCEDCSDAWVKGFRLAVGN